MRNLTTLAIAMLVAAQAAAGTIVYVGSSGSTQYSWSPNGPFFSRATQHTALPSLFTHETLFTPRIEIDTIEGGAGDGVYEYRSRADHFIQFTVEWVPDDSQEEMPPSSLWMNAKRRYKYGLGCSYAVNFEPHYLAPVEYGFQAEFYSSTAAFWPGLKLDCRFTTPWPQPQSSSWADGLTDGDYGLWGNWNPEWAGMNAVIAYKTTVNGRHFYTGTFTYWEELRGLHGSGEDAFLMIAGATNAWSIADLTGRAKTQIRLTSAGGTTFPGW